MASAAEVGAIAQSLTPMMRQYLETKRQNPDAILFFRLGDFYEMFFEDAVEAASILQITLTSRAKGDEKIPMCGVPFHAARGYVAKLVEAGRKVAICDQVEEPGKGKELVRREVTRVVTPGMVLDDELLDARTNNYLAAVCLGEHGGGLALLDASTGELRAGEFPDDQGLVGELARSGARELLISDTMLREERAKALTRALPAALLNGFAAEAFEVARAETLLCRHLGTLRLDGFGLADEPRAVGAAGAALRYLKETQRSQAAHVDRILRIAPSSYMQLDETSCANLEVLRSQRDGKRRGSLLGLLDKSATAMGGRCLARWLAAPLRELPEIERRLDAVQHLSERGVLREELVALLREISDLERLTARCSLGQGDARELRALATSLAKLPGVAAKLSACGAPLLAELGPRLLGLDELAELLQRAIVDEPPTGIKEGGLIREGYSAELDALIAISTRGKDFLLELEVRERERTRIGSLKVRFNRVFGYYIEVTKANLHLVPADYTRRQTTAGGERFITEELKRFEEQILGAEERRAALELSLFEKLRDRVVAHSPALRDAGAALGSADALLSLARAAVENGYVRPQVDESDVLEIVEGRHPVVEQMLRGESREAFVPNDIALDGSARQLLLITGPNMAGKSTAMRQVALIVLMAQVGSFVPARRARIGLCDRVFTRVGASDNLAQGQSTFMVEMTETANILHNATARSLVLLDEIGRGTSTFDGLSIAWAVAEYLHDKVGARTLFATHYHELCDLERERPRVKNLTVAVREWEGRVIFLRKLVPGGASRSYGIEVARLAGLPQQLLARAREVLVGLERAELLAVEEVSGAAKGGRRRGRSPVQLGLFGPSAQDEQGGSGAFEPERLGPTREEQQVLETLRAAVPEELTPLAALNLLARLKQELK